MLNQNNIGSNSDNSNNNIVTIITLITIYTKVRIWINKIVT